ncbi:hypothetical protein MKX01_022576, partial [Papaver californicum]
MRSHYYDDDYCYHFIVLLLVFITTLLVPRLPPGSRRIPLIGNLHQLGNDLPHVSLQKLCNEFGPLMFLKL